MKGLTIGQLAKQAHVNVETIRYYERRGLIPEPGLVKTRLVPPLSHEEAAEPLPLLAL